jgi:hypothetical protein
MFDLHMASATAFYEPPPLPAKGFLFKINFFGQVVVEKIR